MAMQNEILVGRFGQLAQRLFGIRGANPTPQLGPEISLVADLTEPPDENRYLMDERLASGQLNFAAHAATQGWVGIANPAGTNQLVIVEQIVFSNPDVATVHNIIIPAPPFPQAFPPTLGPPLPTGFRDFRIPGNPAAYIGGSNDSSILPWVGTARYVWRAAIPAASSITFDALTFVLSPGTFLVVLCNDSNHALGVCYAWRERPLASSEIS